MIGVTDPETVADVTANDPPAVREAAEAIDAEFRDAECRSKPRWSRDLAIVALEAGAPHILAEHLRDARDTADGRWLRITFFGHNEHTGYVTEVTKHGQPAYRVDLPEKIWGGNPLACITYAASSWFSDYPVTEESVRKSWEAERELARRRAREEAEWARSQDQRALAAADDGGEDDDESEPF